MPRRRQNRSKPLARQAAELSVAVPQVMAHRLARMALAGATPSARDRRELQRMYAEKALALAESWNAMALEALQANQQLMLSPMQAALEMAATAMAPFHRRAIANARRLSGPARRSAGRRRRIR
jgi:hypothetical protein